MTPTTLFLIGLAIFVLLFMLLFLFAALRVRKQADIWRREAEQREWERRQNHE